MDDRSPSPWRRLLTDPLLHMLLIVVCLTCVAAWRSASNSFGYDPISDARVIYSPHPIERIPADAIHVVNPARVPHAG